jgi:serine/threonine protein kinase
MKSDQPPDASAPGPAVPPDDATVISAPDSASSRIGSSALRGPAPQPGRSPSTEIGRMLQGTMLGPYRLDEFVGGGGMGAVFRALDTTLDRTVAVKVLARRESDDEETLRRFRNEAQSAARLDHENIGRVHAVGSEGDWHFIVFEFIEGTNIRDLVRGGGPFGPGQTIDVAIQVADALEHASQREIVHRDIKPSNIVITPAGRARVVDMGLARLHQVAGDAELTVSGMTLGTFDYISPEQARDPRAADVRSDLYSLGCTMFFMLAGRAPFAEGTMVQKLLQHQQAEPPAIDEIRPDVPRRLAAIIDRLMAKDPLDRYQRPAVLVADLLACADAEGIPLAAARSAAIAAPATPPAASRLPWLVPLSLLAAIVAGLWLRSAADRSRAVPRAGPPPTSVPSLAPATESSPAVEPEAVAGITSLSATTAAEVLAALASERERHVIEIDSDGILELPSVDVAGKRVTLQAAPGRQPLLRIRPAPGVAGVRLAGGQLVIRGLAVHLVEPAGGGPPVEPGPRLFQLEGGSLICEAAVLRMPGDPRSAGPESDRGAFVAIGGSQPVELHFIGVRAAGDATLIDVGGNAGGRVSFRWDAGAVLTPRRLLTVEGSRTGSEVSCTLENVVAACGGGLVSIWDPASRPVPSRLTMQASGCRFIVADSTRPFIEQSGIASPDDYAAAVSWEDRHGRYEGGRVFRRIDGAAERVEIPFDDPAVSLVHEGAVGSLPQPSDWVGWGS